MGMCLADEVLQGRNFLGINVHLDGLVQRNEADGSEVGLSRISDCGLRRGALPLPAFSSSTGEERRYFGRE